MNRTTDFWSACRLFLPLLAAGLLIAQTAAHAQANPSEPIYLITSYRSEPANKAAFLKYMQTTGVKRFEEWKKNGTIADYQILFNSFVDFDTWDMMVLLKFAKYADSERWYSVSATMPGGLDAAGLALGQPTNTVVSDLAWQSSASNAADPKEAIYFVIPYEYIVDKGVYMKYFNVYVLPQLTGWIGAGIMSDYRIFMNNHATGSIWDVLFVLEYRDVAAFGRRDQVKQEVRDRLVVENPAWQLIHETKHSVRLEGRTTISQAVLPQ